MIKRALVMLLVTLPLSAIVMRHDREDSRYRALGERMGAAVVDMNLPGGTGTLIAPEWVLTAAHVVKLFKRVPHEVVVGGRKVPVKRVVVYPGGGEGKDDIALVELEMRIDSVKPAALYRGSEENGKQVTFVGRGMSGDGLQGPVARDRVLRASTNRIERVTERWLVFRFDAPPAGEDLEGISGPGDSGGPAFIEQDGKLLLAGVSSGQDSRATGGKEGLYGVDEYYVRVSKYLDWIERAKTSGGQ
jgi:hypothetical protein